ncbi:MAG: hypothetical protein RI911_133 [Candidatus Parcubacteria bacterium]|jgi:uncharacterized integral membrane protein (TIGR00697 family)
MTAEANSYKLLLPIAMLFTVILLVSNTVAVKIVSVGPFMFDAATILFPLAYIFGDILTEVYGYKTSRKIIWYAILTQIVMAASYMAVQYMPSAEIWSDQKAYETILGVTPRIVLASLIAFFAGEFSNAFIMSRMKIASSGRQLWKRTISSTIIGQAVDTSLFVVIAFWGVFGQSDITTMIVSNYIFKVLFECIATPCTYLAVSYLKKAEGVDVYDHDTTYNPFSLS